MFAARIAFSMAGREEGSKGLMTISRGSGVLISEMVFRRAWVP